MAAAERERTPEFLAGLSEPGLAARLASRAAGLDHARLGARRRRLGVRGDDARTARARASSCRAPGVHLNNVLGEEDLSPLGFHAQPPGRRLPSMMAPTVVLHDGVAQLVVGSAGSNRIRSALLQVIVNVVDRGLAAQAAVDAPRVHYAPDGCSPSPGSRRTALAADRAARDPVPRAPTCTSAAARRWCATRRRAR